MLSQDALIKLQIDFLTLLDAFSVDEKSVEYNLLHENGQNLFISD